jgi:hypothetical protein
MRQMRIPCNNCGKTFPPTPDQAQFVSTAKQKGMRLVMLKCTLCGITTSYDPLAGKSPVPETDAHATSAEQVVAVLETVARSPR